MCAERHDVCRQGLHMPNTLAAEPMYALHIEGAALPPRCVSDAVHAYLQQEELFGGYETAAR